MSAPTTTSAPLVARGLVRSFAGRPVLDGVDLVAPPGTRVGLIGENGTGKSTLLRLLAGQDVPDAGSVQVPDDVVHLPQEPEPAADRGTVGTLLDDALRPLHEAVAALERLAGRMAAGSDDADTAAEYDRTLVWAVAHDAWDADRCAGITAAALGVADLDRARPVATLSGGQRTRLALAAALVRRPACLLLDEPTNHLDDEALGLLERELVAMPGVVVAASHDRTFQTWAAQQEEIAGLRGKTHTDLRAVAAGRGPTDNDKFVHAFKGAGVERARARRVHDAERRLEVAERAAVRKPPEPLRFRGAMTTGAPAGLAVEQDPDVGPLGRSAGAAYTALVRATTAEEVPLSACSLVSLGLLHPRDHGTAVGALSVGQRRRLALAVAVAAGPDLLLLDEPTNHVSLRLAAELEQALGRAPGSVVVTSHDRWLRARWEGPSLALGGVRPASRGQNGVGGDG
jgi:macrolide transport system ATP-binding/permease protein